MESQIPSDFQSNLPVRLVDLYETANTATWNLIYFNEDIDSSSDESSQAITTADAALQLEILEMAQGASVDRLTSAMRAYIDEHFEKMQ